MNNWLYLKKIKKHGTKKINEIGEQCIEKKNPIEIPAKLKFVLWKIYKIHKAYVKMFKEVKGTEEIQINNTGLDREDRILSVHLTSSKHIILIEIWKLLLHAGHASHW